jgi:histone H1/5
MVHRFVEANYNLQLGPAQVTQLNRAISSGAEKGTFYLPKGMPITVFVRCSLTISSGLSGRVKLPPKTTARNNDTAAKEVRQ